MQAIAAGANLGAAGRNVGAVRATTPYIAFSDDDSWWAAGALDRGADLLDRDPRLALVCAKILVGREERVDPACRSMATALRKESAGEAVPIVGFVACGAIVRRTLAAALRDRHAREGLAEALRAARWVLRNRMPVPDEIERDVRRTERGP